MQLNNVFKGAHKFGNIIYVNSSLIVSKHLHCLNFLKSTFPQLMHIATGAMWKAFLLLLQKKLYFFQY